MNSYNIIESKIIDKLIIAQMTQLQRPKMVQLYLPNSNKFSNKLLIKRLGAATPNTIQFQNKDSARCHHMYGREKIRNSHVKHNQKKNIIIIQNKKMRYSPLRTFDSPQTKSRKLSFSRMVQESSKIENFNFSYITHFYKNSIQRQVAAKKEKKDKPYFSEVLNVIQYNPHEKGINKFKRMDKNHERCRCHKHSKTVDFRQIRSSISGRKQVSTSMRSRQIKTREGSTQRNRYTASEQKGRRRAINLKVPQNWNVESWGQTKVSERDVFQKEECQP